jgi:hypothetical protein
MQTTVLIVIGLAGLAVFGWRLHRLLNRLLSQIAEQLRAATLTRAASAEHQVSPDQIGREVSHGLAPLRQDLNTQLGRLGESIGGLARELSAAPRAGGQRGDSAAELRQIAAQLGDLTAELRQSQAQLQGTLHLLSEPGALRDWTSQLHSTIVPLERAGASVAQHYQTSADLLSTTSQLLDRWNMQGGLMANSTDRMAQMLDEWAANELSMRQELREQISLRLEEVHERSSAMGSRLGQIESVLARLARAAEANQSAGAATRGTLESLLEQQRQAQADQRQLLDQVGQLSAGLLKQEEVLGARLMLLVEHSQTVSETSQQGLTATLQQTQRLAAAMMDEVRQMTASLHEQSRRTFDELTQQQRGLVQEAAELLGDAGRLARGQPHRLGQIIEIALLLAVLVVLLR